MRIIKITIAVVALALAAGVQVQSQGQDPSPAERAAAEQAELTRMMAMSRPIDAVDSVWMEELTWLEVRDAMRAGKTTVIVPTGGMEQNGPYLATGKHNYVMRATCEAIARKLGNALCAPIVAYVPEGDIDPPTGMMRFPGTISLTESTYLALLTDIANSLKSNGFAHVVLLGDSFDNQPGMKDVASTLSAKWAGSKSRIYFIPEYYDYPGAKIWAEANLGWKQIAEGHHDDPVITTIMMTVDPSSVRISQRIAKSKASINGISLIPVDKAIEAGRKLVDFRSDPAVAAIKKAIASSTMSTP